MNDNRMWVFGYGSLLWDPGFDHDQFQIADLHGYARSFCMRSIHHRGTERDPGLVPALDRDERATCRGVALRVQHGQEEQTLAYLRERELISSAYLEKNLTVHLMGREPVQAVTYVIDADHVQYCGGLALEEQAQIIAKAVGGRGPNWEYLFNTVEKLSSLELHDPDLVWLKQRVHDILR